MANFLRIILLLSAAISSYACAEELATLKWSKVNATYFEFSLPDNFKKVARHGDDSYVGEYQSKTVLLSFDYGLYSNSLQKLDSYSEYLERTEIIHGHKAKIVTYTKPSTKFVIAINFPKGGRLYKSGNALTIISICRSKRDYEVVQKIYASIRFLE